MTRAHTFFRHLHTRIRALAPLALLLLPFLPACDEGTAPSDASPQLVVQAYLFAEIDSAAVQLAASLPLGSTDSTLPPVDDAVVALVRDGTRYTMRTRGAGVYRFEGSAPDMEAGAVFDLVITWRGTQVTARTVVPAAPTGVTLTRDTLWIPESASMTYFRSDSARITVRWDDTDGALWYVSVVNTEADPDSILLASEPLRGARGRFITPPIATPSSVLSILNLSTYGRHRVTVYRINDEYAALYMSREQNSRDLNEPATNLVNGLGIFTAFAGTSRDLVVARR